MIELEKLLKEIKESKINKEYNIVIELVTDELLFKYKSTDLYNEKAEALFRINRFNDALNYAIKSLELDSKNINTLNCLGNISTSLKNYDVALLYFKKAIEIDPFFEKAYINLGNLYSDLKKFDKAEKNYLKAISFNMNNAATYNNLGLLYNELKEYDKAKESYYKSIEIDSNIFNPYNNLGILYNDIGDLDKSEEFYQKSIDVEPNSEFPIFNLGILYAKKGLTEKAIECYNKVIFINSEYSFAYLNLANIYYDNSEFNLAIKNFNIFIKIHTEKDFYYDFAVSRIEEIKKLLEDSSLKKIVEIVENVKNLLLFKEDCITHYTSLSVANILILGRTENEILGDDNIIQKRLNPNSFRLSEGAYLNDTSEGSELLNFLSLKNQPSNLQTMFTEMPFIGSFVSSDKFDDLKSWRMYGKEKNEEAKGCALTICIDTLRNNVIEKLNINKNIDQNSLDFTFYKVAYINNSTHEFNIPNQEDDNIELKSLIDKLKSELSKYDKNVPKEAKDYIDAIEKVNEIVFLFKSTEYSYENEVRLVKMPIGFKTHIDKTQTIPKVYIELAPIHSSLRKITIGPKVERADEWAAAFHYELKNLGHNDCEIFLSNLPFK